MKKIYITIPNKILLLITIKKLKIMEIKVHFQNGKIVKVTDSLISKFIDGKTTPVETIAVFLAAKYNKHAEFLLRGNLPSLWQNITIEEEFKNSITTKLFYGWISYSALSINRKYCNSILKYYFYLRFYSNFWMDFPYEIIYKNTRNAYARINRDGIVIFTIPTRLKNNEKFLTEFLQRGEKLYQRYSQKEKLKSTTDNELLIFWEKLSWSDFFDNDKSYSKATKEKKLKEILLEYSKEWVDKFSDQLWIPYKSLGIRKMRARRWQCSSKQDIVLNLQLVHLPQKYIQYVAAHECAHLVQKNHSDKFWKVVENIYPKYKEVRKEMRKFILE